MNQHVDENLKGVMYNGRNFTAHIIIHHMSCPYED